MIDRPFREWLAEVADCLNMTPQEVMYAYEHRKPREMLYEGGLSPREAADWLRINE